MQQARRGRGRPSVGERVKLGLRVTPTMKERLDRAAEESGRSQSQEAEFRLERSFDRTDLLQEVLKLAYGEDVGARLMEVGREMTAAKQGKASAEPEFVGLFHDDPRWTTIQDDGDERVDENSELSQALRLAYGDDVATLLAVLGLAMTSRGRDEQAFSLGLREAAQVLAAMTNFEDEQGRDKILRLLRLGKIAELIEGPSGEPVRALLERPGRANTG
jgi:hypothetical protein